jgi:hypothetical protein
MAMLLLVGVAECRTLDAEKKLRGPHYCAALIGERTALRRRRAVALVAPQAVRRRVRLDGAPCIVAPPFQFEQSQNNSRN